MWINSSKEMPKIEGIYLVYYIDSHIHIEFMRMYIGQETTMCESPIELWNIPLKDMDILRVKIYWWKK